ncbi:ABC transporter permease [Pelomonas sp. V22]|uniref:ABC transporter permease n=1 Tax=Pelomonas sp. V22 TaxID=2822139 RepID=UPI0024A8B0B4|nr:ABC transporter permease [Pelomonas sp. V22]MDI4632195.1 ABC transporter permease [Pelomonas sp. V22]
MNFRIFFKQFTFGLRVYLRLPAAVFWTLAFPIVMLLGLGTVFGGGKPPTAHLVWAQSQQGSPDDALMRTALAERGLEVETVTVEAADERWRAGKLPALLEGEGGQYRLRLNSYLAAQGAQAEALVQQAFLVAQARRQGAEPPARLPVEMSSPGGRHAHNYAAYLLPGLLGLNLVMLGVFSTGMVDVTMREKGGYKRLAATPLSKPAYLAAQLGVRLVIMTAGAVTLLLTGWLVFGIRSEGSLGALFALLLLGAACFIAMGYVLASLTRTVEAYGGIANLVFLPLMLLSGVYFSLDAAPHWLQLAAASLPLAPLLSALRAVFNDGASLASQGQAMAIVGAWAVVLFGLAVRRFRWV